MTRAQTRRTRPIASVEDRDIISVLERRTHGRGLEVRYSEVLLKSETFRPPRWVARGINSLGWTVRRDPYLIKGHPGNYSLAAPDDDDDGDG